MIHKLSNLIVNIKPSGIRKFFDLVSEKKDVISLGVGEPDFDTPWHVREEGIYSLEKGKTFYTSNSGLSELRSEICNYLQRRFNLTYNPLKEVLVTVGGSEGIDLAFRSLIDDGDEVIIPEPCYVSYKPCALLAGAKIVNIKLSEENNFKLNIDELRSAITSRTKILVLPFPNNPTGAILEKDDIIEIAKVCVEKNIYVLSDEIYSELTYEKKHCSIAGIDGMKERTIYVNGFSKAYAMTGWRLGYVCADSAIIEQMTKIHQFAIMCAPTASQYAAIEALKNGDNDIEYMRESYNQRRRFLMKSFEDIGLQCFEPFGAFYVFPSIKKYNLTSEEFALKFLEEENVAVIPGTAFGDSGEGFLRISYAYSIEKLKLAMEKLKRFIDRI